MCVKKEPKKGIYFKIDPDDLEKLRILTSESLGLTRSDIIRIALKKYIISNADVIENYYKELEEIKKKQKKEN